MTDTYDHSQLRKREKLARKRKIRSSKRSRGVSRHPLPR